MWALRFLLAILSVGAAGWIVYRGFVDHPHPIWPLYVVPPTLLLNAYCLVTAAAPKFRIFRLFGLWFDAKETELRARARKD
jgi:hypothetical protein